MSSVVTSCNPAQLKTLRELLQDYGMQIHVVAVNDAIPGSFWGENEAGLIGNILYLRGDTPLHSALHEACHYICMDDARRAQLHTDAGGDVPEENAVCYLQGLLADKLAKYDRNMLFGDMDAWGYSFRLGSAKDWFEQDADDARTWLFDHRIIDQHQRPTGRLRH
jgi:hypothetical protein